MAKYPSEIFGFPYSNHSPIAIQNRERFWCPFVNKVCYKKSRLIEYPFGACTVHYSNEDIAVCPRRFLDQNRVFTDIAKDYFKSLDNLIIFPEVRLKDTGNFDFVIVKHAPLSAEVVDFVAVEFQTGQTTQTGQLVKGFVDYLEGKDVFYHSYSFGVNFYDIWKRTFTQILNKGIIMENWGKHIYWVIQEPVYQYFEHRYKLEDIGYHENHSTVFVLYELRASQDRYELLPARKTSATIDQLFHSFRNNLHIPSREEFIHALSTKMADNMQLSLNLGIEKEIPALDIAPPTSSGKIRDEDSEDYLD
jgi:hypothetical protein